jgi:hypothetical protein
MRFQAANFMLVFVVFTCKGQRLDVDLFVLLCVRLYNDKLRVNDKYLRKVVRTQVHIDLIGMVSYLLMEIEVGDNRVLIC